MTAAPIVLPSRLAPAASPGHRFRVEPPLLFASGNEIYAQGERVACLYRVAFGAVRLYRLLSDGRRQIFAFHLPGEIFGFEPGDEHHFFADAICATGLHVLPRPAVPGSDATIATAALHCLVRTQEHLLVVGRQNAVERVAVFLLDMAERQGGLEQFDLPMSRSDIGDYLGLTIETVSRIISRLRSQGVIKLVSMRSLSILKPGALKAMSS
jgi:CRP/FNR family transcriptional regulator, nitrogen fixation regulation protein